MFPSSLGITVKAHDIGRRPSPLHQQLGEGAGPAPDAECEVSGYYRSDGWEYDYSSNPDAPPVKRLEYMLGYQMSRMCREKGHPWTPTDTRFNDLDLMERE